MIKGADVDCVFCLIYSKKIDTPIIMENDSVFVINDIRPKASIHYLIISKEHFCTIAQVPVHSVKPLGAAMFSMIHELAEYIGEGKAFRIVSNNGKAAGQSVDHIHMHFLAGDTIPTFE